MATAISDDVQIAQDITAKLLPQAEEEFDRLYEEYQEAWDKQGIEQADEAFDKVDGWREWRNWLEVSRVVLDNFARAHADGKNSRS